MVATTQSTFVALSPDSATHGATINLRAPIVINPRRMIGLQVMTPASDYAVDHPFALE